MLKANKRKKTFFVFVLCLFSFSAFCQQDISKCHPCLNKCEILNNLLKDSTVQHFLNFKFHQDTPIVIVDLGRFFDKCDLGNINGRMTKIVTDSSLIEQNNNSNIIVYSKSMERKKYMIELYLKKTHGYGWVIIKERHKKFYGIKSAFGILD